MLKTVSTHFKTYYYQQFVSPDILKRLTAGNLLLLLGWFLVSTLAIDLPALANFSRNTFWYILALAFLNLLALIFIGGYLLKKKHELIKDQKIFLLMAGISVFLLLSARYLAPLNPLYLPITAAAVIYSIVCADYVTAFLFMLYSCFFSAIIFERSYFYFLLFIFNSLFAIYFSRQVLERTDITKTGLWTAAGNVLVYWSLIEIFHNPAQEFIAGALVLMLVSFVSVIFVLGILPYLEDIFMIVTPLKLLELASPNNPLLKRLMTEAPGTYHHSLMVANLAEAAIEATSGNALLARVAAYYHDIGKIKRPDFFIENQTIFENPHDQINNKLSSLIIQSHTKDGVEIGRQYGLPKVILDIIEQHHGTSVIAYFYRNFLDEKEKNSGSPEESLTEDDFRYPGTKPQTRESAILMLADSCEAAIRALEKPSPAKISAVINKLVNEKSASGQLDECNFTFRDMTCIKNAFANILAGAFHARVKYGSEPQEKNS